MLEARELILQVFRRSKEFPQIFDANESVTHMDIMTLLTDNGIRRGNAEAAFKLLNSESILERVSQVDNASEANYRFKMSSAKK